LQADVVGDGLDLPGIGAGTDDEIIGERGDGGEVQDADVGGFLGFGGADGGEPVRDGRWEFRGLVDVGLLQNTLLKVSYYKRRRKTAASISPPATSAPAAGSGIEE
jgi:hypothetical protein